MSPRLPPLESLRVFEASARQGSFTAAAGELGVTPAAVSLRVRDLEADLGVPLFTRAGPRVALTPAGAELARRIGGALQAVREAVEDCRGGPRLLRITAAPTIGARWLAPRLGRYAARPGAVPVQLDVSGDLRGAGEFDVSLRSGRGDWPGLRAVRLMAVEHAPLLAPALAARAQLERPEDLLQLPLLPADDWSRWFAAAGAPLARPTTGGVRYPSQDVLAEAALAGEGVALLSPTIFAPQLADGRLVQPFAEVLRGPDGFMAVCAETEARAPVLDFIAWLCAETAAA